MDPLTQCVKYCNEKRDSLLPHYFVDLTETKLTQFEILNSMYLLDYYDNLLLLLESQYTNSNGNIMVPPFDILIVLFTLVTVSDHYKETSLRESNPYNMTKMSLGKRAIKILNYYINLIEKFDIAKFDQYDLELLRCQFFLVIDSLLPKPKRFSITGLKSAFDGKEFNINSTLSSRFVNSLDNPYKAYICSIDKKYKVFNNLNLIFKLNQPNQFTNMVHWALFTSISNNEPLYYSSHNIWIPLLEMFTKLFDFRQRYFIAHENIYPKKKKKLFTQGLADSPLVKLYKIIYPTNFNVKFCESLFINCDYDDNKTNDMLNDETHVIYKGEDEFVDTFIARIKYPKTYKYQKSMKLRKCLLSQCFNLITSIPKGHILTNIKINTEIILTNITNMVCAFNRIEQFNSFIHIYDMEMELAFMPVIIEKLINSLTDGKYNLVDQIISIKYFCSEWDDIIKRCLNKSLNNIKNENDIRQLEKIENCLYVLFQYFECIQGKEDVKQSKYWRKTYGLLHNFLKRRKIVFSSFQNTKYVNINALEKIINSNGFH